MVSIFEIIQFAFLLLGSYMLVREAYIIFNLYRNFKKGMRLYYFPIIGFQWRMAFWKDKKDEWGWLKDLVADMDKKGETVIIANTILNAQPLYFIVGSDLIADYFKNEANIAIKVNAIKNPIVNMGFFYKNDPKDLKMRGIFSRIFEAKNLRKISPEIQAIVKENIQKIISENFATKETVIDLDLNPYIGNIFLNIVDRVLFGDCQTKIDGENFTTVIISLFGGAREYEFSAENLITLGQAKAFNMSARVKKLKERAELVNEAIYQRYKYIEESGEIENSFLGNMIAYNKEHPEDQISVENIVGSCALFVFASFNTTKNTTSWALNFLKQDKDTQQLIYRATSGINLQENTEEQLNKLENCPILDYTVKETLRLGNPFMSSDFKKIIKNCVLGGIRFKKGDLVVLSTGASSFKTKKFTDPKHFNPGRFNTDKKQTWQRMDYIPFLGGIRGCIGQYLALMNLKIILKEFVETFKLEDDPSFDTDIGKFPFHILAETKARISLR